MTEANSELPAGGPRKSMWPAAGAVLAIVAIGPLMWLFGSHLGWQVYRSDSAHTQQVTLDDGSTVVLNTNSELRVRLSKKHRELILTRGEALFTAADDRDRPFEVLAADTLARALGTVFAIRLTDQSQHQQQVEVIVTTGSVAVAPHGTANAGVSTLAAGEGAIIDAHSVRVQKIDAEDLTHRLAWARR
jgi:transmembrane sensor